MVDFFERLKEDKVVIIDGGMGTEMEKRGAKMEERGWSASCTLTEPDLLREIHEDYIKAGAEMIITNTFSTAKHVLEDCGLGDRFREINAAAVRIAREARDNAAERPVWVAGSISTNWFTDEQEVTDDILRSNFEQQAEIFAESGIDTIPIGTGPYVVGDFEANRYLELDTEFHHLIFDHAGNDYLTASYTRYVGKIAALRTHLAKLPQHTELSFEEHVGLAKAVREGKIAVIRDLLAQHIDRTRQAYVTAAIVMDQSAVV